MKVFIIGIDCATDSKNMGIAAGYVEGNKIEIFHPGIKGSAHSIANLINQHISKYNHILVSMDAPLGWPHKLNKVLDRHYAGEIIREEPNKIFFRETDRVVEEKIDLKPMAVGADKIARTAHSALKLLEELRNLINNSIPLSWDKNLGKGISVIEVYPAATLKAHQMPYNKYKKTGEKSQRIKILEKLKQHIRFRNDISPFQSNADVLDAAICIFAAFDFLSGKVIQPKDMNIAKKEGWIWLFEAK